MDKTTAIRKINDLIGLAVTPGPEGRSASAKGQRERSVGSRLGVKL